MKTLDCRLLRIAVTADARPDRTMAPMIGVEVTIEFCGAGPCGRLVFGPRIVAGPDVLDIRNRDQSMRQ
ncbi:hypothetical protein [Rhizobium sp. SG570]|uniref:hypothetical protein n=1 Tax=Rhizobium sp. SG570 TaxID=2587113 RepID=UPI00119AAC40|nr:hypothetical protein [Rhizobium sp. SG570]NKJ39357.1 hypothetical protein [Rhizobium sp. SG570]